LFSCELLGLLFVALECRHVWCAFRLLSKQALQLPLSCHVLLLLLQLRIRQQELQHALQTKQQQLEIVDPQAAAAALSDITNGCGLHAAAAKPPPAAEGAATLETSGSTSMVCDTGGKASKQHQHQNQQQQLLCQKDQSHHQPPPPPPLRQQQQSMPPSLAGCPAPSSDNTHGVNPATAAYGAAAVGTCGDIIQQQQQKQQLQRNQQHVLLLDGEPVQTLDGRTPSIPELQHRKHVLKKALQKEDSLKARLAAEGKKYTAQQQQQWLLMYEEYKEIKRILLSNAALQPQQPQQPQQPTAVIDLTGCS
jgi:hypothetical protein